MRIRRLLPPYLVPLFLILTAAAQTPAATPTRSKADAALQSGSVAQTATGNDEAARLMGLASEALRKHDFATTQTLLDQVKAISPSEKNLAGTYGALSYDRDDFPEAIRNYQREIALHPDSVWVYAPMARAQVRIGHRDDAIASLRAWVAAAPDTPAASVALASLLLETNEATGAVQAAKDGIAGLPTEKRNDAALNLLLGRAQIAAGDQDAGIATFTTQLKENNDPLALNNTAYELAKTGKSLPLAEFSERKAITRLAADSRTWTMDENPQILLAKTSLIIASWDTFGFILFSEGKYDEALDFIRAAWTNSAHEEIGEHLGDLYDKQGNHQDALKTYEMTLATIPSSASADKSAPSPDVKRLKDKIEAQKKAGARPEKLDAAAALVRLRTLSLGAAGGHEGSAEYLLLLSRDRVENARPTGDKSVTGGIELILKGDVSHFTPISFDVRLAKQGILNCRANTCEVIFEP